MADRFIVHDVDVASLAAAGSVSGTDLVLINSGGVHKKATVAQVASGENAVLLTGDQTIAGVKTFSSAPVMSGASITSGTVALGALANIVGPGYIAAGTRVAGTFHFVLDEVTASGASTTVTLTAPADFISANYILLIQDEAAPGTWIAPSAQLAGSFTFASTNTHVYQFLAIGV